MKKSEVLRAWPSILAGRAPSLSIEITKECPLTCPGCYGFTAHLGTDIQLRQLAGLRGAGYHRVLGPLTAGHIFSASERIGKAWRRMTRTQTLAVEPSMESPFHIL
jgi:hypothetical protein